MRILVFALILLSSQLSWSNQCQVSGGPGETQVYTLGVGEFLEQSRDGKQTIVSCGPFENDGSVVVAPDAAVIELATDTCDVYAINKSLKQIIYCY